MMMMLLLLMLLLLFFAVVVVAAAAAVDDVADAAAGGGGGGGGGACAADCCCPMPPSGWTWPPLRSASPCSWSAGRASSARPPFRRIAPASSSFVLVIQTAASPNHTKVIPCNLSISLQIIHLSINDRDRFFFSPKYSKNVNGL